MQTHDEIDFDRLDAELFENAVPTTIVDRTASRLPASKTTESKPTGKAKSAKPEPVVTEAMLSADRLWRQLGILHERTAWSFAVFSVPAGLLGAFAPTGVFPAIYVLGAAIGFVGGMVAFKTTRRLLILRITLQLASAYVCSLPFFFIAQLF